MKLPVGWRKIKLKDCGKWLGGATPSKDKASFWNGDIPWASSQDIKSRTLKSTTYSITVEGLNNSSSNLIPVNSLLMVTRSGILRHTFPVSKTLFPVAINQDIKALIPHIEFSTDYIQALLSVDNVNILKLCSKVGTTVESIEYDALRSYLLLFPPLSEQQRIAEFLGTWDEAIEKLERLIAAKEKRLNWIRFHVLTGRIRLDKYSKTWELQRLSNILHEHGTKSSGREVVHSVSVHKGVVNQIEHLGRNFSAKDTSNYNLAKSGDIIYTKSPTGDFPYGIIKMNQNKYNVIISPLYGVFTPAYPELGIWLDCYFEAPENTNNYLHPIIQKGAKNTINITNKTFLSNTLFLPTERAEVQAICRIISMVKTELKLLQQELAALQKQKCGLMQKLLTGTWRV